MAPSPEDIQNIFLKVVALPADERDAAVECECADQPELQQRVQELLAAHDQPDSYLDESEATVDATYIVERSTSPGTTIGPYKLLEQIGEGGMGAVWVARQSAPIKRKVAIKLIKAGMDSGQVLARFEAERQALAMMDHPNIARVLDGGMTEQGRPYFAMEYVKGVPLNEYCDNARLSLTERLELFVPVCQAVQHAHQKGIIHRDLKPSNILICLYDGKPVPKVIDFGLAKAMHHSLTDKSIYTAHGMMVGTPLYMSPEQAETNNLDIDTRTDIYALGVLLYELLTGTTPLERAQMKQAAYDEVLRLIKEVEPPKPSTRLSGSASLPSVAAQRGIEPAQLTRSITGDLDWVVMKALEKERSRRYETANGLAEDIRRHLSDQPVSASPPSTSYRVRKFIRRNRVAVITASAIAITLLLGVAGTTGGMFWALSERKDAVAAREAESDAKLEAIAQSERADIEAKRATAAATQAALDADAAIKNRDRASANLDLSLNVLDELYLRAIGRDRLMGMVKNEELIAPASLSSKEKQLLEIGLKFYEQISQQEADNDRARYRVALASTRLGALNRSLGNHETARDAYTQAIDLLRVLSSAKPRNRDFAKGLAMATIARACLGHAGMEDARVAIRESIGVCTHAIELNPEDPNLFAARAFAQRMLGNHRDGEQDMLRAIGLEPDTAHLHATLGWAYAFPPQVQPDLAVRHLEIAVSIDRTARNLSKLGRVRKMLQGDDTEAWTLLDEAVRMDPREPNTRIQRAILFEESEEPDYQRALEELDIALELQPGSPYAHRRRARVLGKLKRYDEAFEAFAKSESIGGDNPFWLFVHRANVYAELGRHDDEAADLVRAVLVAPGISFSWYRVWQACQRLGDIASAKESLEPLCSAPAPEISARGLALLAGIQIRHGQFREAEDSISKSVVSYQRFRDRLDGDVDQSAILHQNPLQAIPTSLIAECPDTQLRTHLFAVSTLLQYLQGDQTRSHQMCEQALQEFSSTTDANVANEIAWTCSLAPDTVKDHEKVVALAEQAVRLQPQSASVLNTLGSALHRSGRHAHAIERLREAETMLKGYSRNYSCYFLAMAEHELGNQDEAQRWLREANERVRPVISNNAGTKDWRQFATLKLLHDEANSLITNGRN